MAFKLDYRRYSLGFREPVRTAHGLWSSREGFIVRIETSDGRMGYGEIAPIPWFGSETLENADNILGRLKDSCDERTLLTIARDYPCTAGGMRFAIEDACASEEAAGGRGATPDAALPVAALLPAGKACLARSRVLAEAGFRIFKWKVGVGAADDEMVLLDELLACLPSGSKLRLDANGAWDRRKAESWLSRCAERPIEHVEQPVATDSQGSEDVLFGLSEDYPTEIALDESLACEADFDRWLGLGWRGVYVIKPLLLADAGIRCESLAVAKAKVVFSSALETAVGARHAIRLAFRWKGERRALGMGVWPLFSDSRFDGPALAPFIRYSDLMALNPERLWNALS